MTEFEQLVLDMRNMQKRYYSAKPGGLIKRESLKDAKILEKMVDDYFWRELNPDLL